MSNVRSIVAKHDHNIYQVRVPLPFPLRWINAYLVQGSEGFTLIDPGLHTDEALKVWEEALATIGITYSDIHQIVLTHHHPDHLGLAGHFQQQTGAKVWLSDSGIKQAYYLWGHDRKGTMELHSLFMKHGKL